MIADLLFSCLHCIAAHLEHCILDLMTLKLVDNFIGLMIQRSEQTTERRLFECTEGNALLDGKRCSSCAVDQLGIFCIKLDAESWQCKWQYHHT